MKIGSVFFGIAALGLVFASSNSYANKESKKLPDLVKICKKDCPDVKTNADAHECVEDKAKGEGGEAFKKTKCWLENEKYEKMVGG